MTATEYHLAQINIARARYDTEDPRFQSFIDLLEPVNAMAERMPGFVWRLQDESSDGAVDIQAFEDPRIIVNMSVWQDIEALYAFAFKTAHAKVMTRRREWFEPMETAYLALWWIPAGHVPTVEEAKERLARLDAEGPTPFAFDFRSLFDSEGNPVAPKLPRRDCA